MPEFLQIPDFAKAGLNTDFMPWDLPPSFLTNLKNVRISRNKLSPFGGYNVITTLPADFEPGHVRHIPSSTGFYWIIAGQDSVLCWDGASLADISNLLGYPPSLDELKWTSCMLANIPVLNNPGWYPEYWSPQSPGTDLVLLPWDAGNTWQDANESCKIVRSHKQFLFAMDLISNGTEIADGVRWSSPADINSVPETWDPLDTTNFAGIVNLGGEGGQIIDGYSLRDAFCIYRYGGISVFDFIGGEFVWQIRHLSNTIGLLSKNCLVEVKGAHFGIGDGDVFYNDGNSIKSIMHNRVKKKFIAELDPVSYKNSFALKNNTRSEIWFCVPEAGETFATLAYIYNWRDDTWAIRDLPELPHAAYGVRTSPPITWDNIGGTWDTNLGNWNKQQISPLDSTIFGVTIPPGAGQSGELITLDEEVSNVSIQFDSILERVGFALGGLNTVTTITRIYPHMTGPGSVYIQIGSQDYPGASIRWKEPVLFNPETDRKVDIRTTGELHCFKVFAQNIDSTWEISGMDIEFVGAGYR